MRNRTHRERPFGKTGRDAELEGVEKLTRALIEHRQRSRTDKGLSRTPQNEELLG